MVDLSRKFYFRTLVRVIHKFEFYSVLFSLEWSSLWSIKDDIPIKQVILKKNDLDSWDAIPVKEPKLPKQFCFPPGLSSLLHFKIWFN